MSKLRTLKDLKDIDFAADDNNVIYGFSEVLKQEAINDYKFYLKKVRNNDFNNDETRDFILGKLNYIKWKFNLTEKDLK